MTNPTQYAINQINQCFKDASKKLWEEFQPNYCAIGMDHCVNCGWEGEYPVSGCPSCHKSFIE